MAKVQEKCFCAFCKNERRVYLRRHIGFSEVLSSLLLSVLFSFIFWQQLRAEALAFFVMVLIITECLIHFRYRLGLACPYCGFDPILYRRDPQAAARVVKDFMERRKQDPLFYLSNKGYDKLARRKIAVEERRQQLQEVLAGELSVKDKPFKENAESPDRDTAASIEEIRSLPPF